MESILDPSLKHFSKCTYASFTERTRKLYLNFGQI